MKPYDWSAEKNEWLKEERGISFEDILTAINDNHFLKTIKHPNQKKYPNQFIMIIEINNYAYIVPFTVDSNKIFLKTIYPSRDATKKYLSTKK